MDSREVLARFEAERQALAVMDHPNIAKVLDGGTTVAGRPFFVMEYVPGVPLTEYCDAERVDTTPRSCTATPVPCTGWPSPRTAGGSPP
jgi:eukaryotic-like serine/threonine-protein kinase